MFKHRLDHHGIDRSVAKGDAVRVGDELDVWRVIDVESGDLQLGMFIERTHALTYFTAANDQRERHTIARQRGDEPLDVAARAFLFGREDALDRALQTL